MASIIAVTHIVTPYQVELFDAIQRRPGMDLRVVYLVDAKPHREWHPSGLVHEAIQLAHATADDVRRVNQWMRQADLVIVGHYRNIDALRWMGELQAAGRPWCFWGERPGFRFSGLVGRSYRAWKLRTLRASRAPIWGIGQWAVDGWEREFGSSRRYFNVPYFSDLDRFNRTTRTTSPAGRRVLFSGSLIERKGVDLLAAAFKRVAREDPGITLSVVGSGPMQARLRSDLAPLADRVVFHGFQQWAELPDFYARADVLCVPSRYDGWGLVVPEGLAAGLPVICTDRMGAAVDLIAPGVNGWIAKAGDSDSLYLALSASARAAPEELAGMSEAAKRSVSRHQLEDGVSRFCEAVEGTLESWRRPPDPTPPREGRNSGKRLD